MDMLRFHKFTIGWNWVADYGSSDDADEFAALKAYSPLHNIKPGGKYPATLVTTADHDDRVVPAHSFKYAATLQALASHDTPLLIRIETNSAHGASGLDKQLDTAADIYSFIMFNLGVTPAVPGGSDRAEWCEQILVAAGLRAEVPDLKNGATEPTEKTEGKH